MNADAKREKIRVFCSLRGQRPTKTLFRKYTKLTDYTVKHGF